MMDHRGGGCSLFPYHPRQTPELGWLHSPVFLLTIRTLEPVRSPFFYRINLVSLRILF